MSKQDLPSIADTITTSVPDNVVLLRFRGDYAATTYAEWWADYGERLYEKTLASSPPQVLIEAAINESEIVLKSDRIPSIGLRKFHEGRIAGLRFALETLNA